MINPRLVMTEIQHKTLLNHMFPGDELESAAILVCGRTGIGAYRLCVHQLILIPHDACSIRTPTRLAWPGRFLDEAIEIADEIDGSILLMHSHPGCMFEFSEQDDASDQISIPSLIHGCTNRNALHGSAIIVPDGSISARVYEADMHPIPVHSVTKVGTNIRDVNHLYEKLPIAYTEEMANLLKQKVACVVGASGTGSIVAELLSRLGVGKLILVDFDVIEEKNLNRIMNTCRKDIGEYKTRVLKRVIEAHHPTLVTSVEASIEHDSARFHASEADVLFSCVDSMEGRYHCDVIAQQHLCPLVDIGISIPTRRDDQGSIQIGDVVGRVDYVHPNSPSLWDRGVVTPEGLNAEYLKKVATEDYRQRVKEGYLVSHAEEAPAVISANATIASLGVNEWLARLMSIRHIDNNDVSRIFTSLSSLELEYEELPISNFTKADQGIGLVQSHAGAQAA